MPDTVSDAEHVLGAVVRRIHVDPERTLALRQVDHPHDLPGHLAGVGVRRREFGELAADVVHQPGVTLLVRRGDGFVGGVAGGDEVVGADGEGAGHDDRGLDVEAG